jgi:hypothetical protein
MLSFAALFAACKQNALRAKHGIEVQYSNHVLNPLPFGQYDAVFRVNQIWSEHWSNIELHFFDDSGNWYPKSSGTTIPTGMSVSVNGYKLKRGVNERVEVDFLTPVTWQITGNDLYPSVTHTMRSDTLIEYLSPQENETIKLSDSLVVTYRAPADIDTVLIHLAYMGRGVHSRDTTKSEETGQSYYYHAPNTGKYVIPPFKLRDIFKSLDVKELRTFIMWERGDSIHLGPYVYGFVILSSTSRDFKVKQ